MGLDAADSKRGRGRLVLWTLAGGAALLAAMMIAFRPDRPVAHIVPGSSAGPAFVVQVIRPRLGLPVGGLLPPELFGLDAALGFDSDSPGASFGAARSDRIELRSDDWDLVLEFDDGIPIGESHVVFELVFEDRTRTIRARPGHPAIGTFGTTRLEDARELSGQFEFELEHCEDAETGEALGWPPEPLLLRGSFDRLPLGGPQEDR